MGNNGEREVMVMTSVHCIETSKGPTSSLNMIPYGGWVTYVSLTFHQLLTPSKLSPYTPSPALSIHHTSFSLAGHSNQSSVDTHLYMT